MNLHVSSTIYLNEKLDGSNYQNNIEVEDIRLFIIEENSLKKVNQKYSIGDFIFFSFFQLDL